MDREAAKISALSSGELEKYEYLTDEGLGYKPDVIQKAQFEYYPMGKFCNKRLDESDKKEGRLKRLKNAESKNEQQLKTINDQEEKQLNAIEKQNKNKLRAIEKDKKIVYLTDGTSKLLEIYSKSCNKRNIDSLEVLARNEGINHKSLSYKILFGDETDVKSHKINFFKKFVILHGLLKNLVSSEINTTNANIDQVGFIDDLLMGL